MAVYQYPPITPLTPPVPGKFHRPIGPPPLPDFPPIDPMVAAFVEALQRIPEILPQIVTPNKVTRLYLPITNIPVNLNPAQVSTLLSFSVPPAHKARLTLFGNAASDLSNVQWDLQLRGGSVDPIAGLVGPFGTVTQPIQIPGGGILAEEGDDLRVLATNIGIGVITSVQVVLMGFLWAGKG